MVLRVDYAARRRLRQPLLSPHQIAEIRGNPGAKANGKSVRFLARVVIFSPG
jgi:hypothetical protein